MSTNDDDLPVRLVISQPMLLPWLGMFEQIKLCTHFVFYDDVQLPLGGGRGRGFITRVQIKTASGIEWLSLPVHRSGQGRQLICDARFSHGNWKREHLGKIEQAYRAAPHFDTVFEQVVKPLYAVETTSVSEFCIQSTLRLCAVLGLTPQVHVSSLMDVSRDQEGSSRVLAICRHFAATEYISGLGAMNYIHYADFEQAGIRIHYMNYRLPRYPQLHGPFTPYVSVLDLLFNVGLEAAGGFAGSECKYWKDWPHFSEGRPVSAPVG